MDMNKDSRSDGERGGANRIRSAERKLISAAVKTSLSGLSESKVANRSSALPADDGRGERIKQICKHF